MSSLPISTQTPQPSGNTINVTSNSNPADNQEAGPFADLLARQINGAELAMAHVQSLSIEDLAANSQKNGQDAAVVPQDPAALAMPTGDPTNALSAIMMQLPLEARPRLVAEAGIPDSSGTSRQAAPSSITLSTGTSAPDTKQTGTATQAALNASLLATKSSGTTGKLSASELSTAPQNTDAALTPLPSENSSGKSILPAASDIRHTALNPSGDTSKQVELQSSPTQPTPTQTNAMPATTPGTSTLMRADYNTATVNTPLGNNGWAEDFSQQISWLSTQKNQVAELHLNPPDLGPLDVVLTMNDKQASIQFSSPHGVVRDAVENALPKLREIFADNGIMLGNTTVSDQTPRDRNAAGFMNQNPGSGTRRDSDGENSQAGVQAVNDSPALAVRRHIGMVDTFA